MFLCKKENVAIVIKSQREETLKQSSFWNWCYIKIVKIRTGWLLLRMQENKPKMT